MKLRLSHRHQVISPRALAARAAAGLARAGLKVRRLRPADTARVILGVEVALTLALAGVSAGLVWAAFEPPAWAGAVEIRPAAPPRRAAVPAVLTELDPFHRAGAPGSPAAGATAAPETLLNLTLFGIRASADGGPGSAIIAAPDNTQGVFIPGQEIMPGVRLERILSDRVVIRRNGVSESLSFERESTLPPASAPVSPQTSPQTSPQVSLLARVRVTQGERGLVIQGSDEPELLERAGLEAGDILLTVNGTATRDTAALAALPVTSLSSLTLEIERKGQRKFHRLPIDRMQ